MVEDPAGVRPRRGFAAYVAMGPVLLIRMYQVTLGPLMGGHCRFIPTCSHYGLEAYRVHGVARGTWLTARRVLRCHPFGGGGYDPVPPAREDEPARGDGIAKEP